MKDTIIPLTSPRHATQIEKFPVTRPNIPVKLHRQQSSGNEGFDRLMDVLNNLHNGQVDMGRRLDALESHHIAQFGPSRAGTLNSYSDEDGTAGVVMHNGSLYKGGSTILSNTILFPLDAAQGTVMSGTWSADDHNLMAGTVLAEISAKLGNTLAPWADRIAFDFTINGQVVPQMKRILVSEFVSTLDNERRLMRPDFRLPEVASFGFNLTALKPLLGPVGTTGEFWVVAGATA